MIPQPSIPAIVAIAASAGGFVVLTVLLWFLLPRYLERVFRRIDVVVPADIAVYAPATARVLTLVLGAMMLAAVIFTTLTQLGFDTTAVQASARDNGAAVAMWVGPRMLQLGVVLLIAFITLRIVARATPRSVRMFLRSRMDIEDAQAALVNNLETEKRAQTLEGVFKSALTILILAIALFTALSIFGVPVGPVLAGFGILGIAVGFGAQSLVRDIISGTFIIMEDQYRVGDVVRIAGTAGLVEDINLRRTVLRDLDFIQHYIRHGDITTASNFTKEKSRVNLDISVAYKEDLDNVIEVINRVGQEMSQDDYFGPLIRDPLKVLRVNSFDESGIAIKVLGETLPIRQWEVAGEFRKRLKRAFNQEGIEIPFPHRTLYWGAEVETKIRQQWDGHREEAPAASRRKPADSGDDQQQ